MSTDTILTSDFHLPADQPLRLAVRRLRWFKSTFEAKLRSISSESGVTYRIDTPKLTRCFIEWLRAFEAQKPKDTDERLAYVGFAAGLMLRQLIQDQPIEIERIPDDANPDDPAIFWPEGYLYVMYCLHVRQAILKEDFDQDVTTSPALNDIRTWWSFKENVHEDPAMAIGFLDLFAGDEPHWSMPMIFKARTFGPKALGTPSFPHLTIVKG